MVLIRPVNMGEAPKCFAPNDIRRAGRVGPYLLPSPLFRSGVGNVDACWARAARGEGQLASRVRVRRRGVPRCGGKSFPPAGASRVERVPPQRSARPRGSLRGGRDGRLRRPRRRRPRREDFAFVYSGAKLKPGGSPKSWRQENARVDRRALAATVTSGEGDPSLLRSRFLCSAVRCVRHACQRLGASGIARGPLAPAPACWGGGGFLRGRVRISSAVRAGRKGAAFRGGRRAEDALRRARAKPSFGGSSPGPKCRLQQEVRRPPPSRRRPGREEHGGRPGRARHVPAEQPAGSGHWLASAVRSINLYWPFAKVKVDRREHRFFVPAFSGVLIALRRGPAFPPGSPAINLPGSRRPR